jgi:glycosyltransferase involved in cell wall biosynthesis
MIKLLHFGLETTMTHLVICPSVPAWKINDALCFDRKFYDGMLLYTQKWPGKISCVISLSSARLPDFGIATINISELPFECITLNESQLITADHLQGASIILGAGDSNDQLHLGKLCRERNIKCVYVIENIPETRYQIASLSTKNPIVRLRRYLYLWQGERKRVAAFNICDGLQSNGTPAHFEYGYVNNNLLYFDTRVFENQIISDGELQQRLDYLAENKPLRIAFSGRLVKIKGVDHLVELALKLKNVNTPVELRIYGAGDMDIEMRELISRYHLENNVSMLGAVDFYETLIPELKRSVDLFVCLHRQSDPSCTYLETLSCGIPIVGYKNRAFAGLLDISDIGWGAELNDLDGVCRAIVHLNSNREDLIEKSKNSAAFARLHDFGSTFERRINHLLATSERQN